MFENDVKMYGTQARVSHWICLMLFENDVKMYGTQAMVLPQHTQGMFENDVKMYGTQAQVNIKRSAIKNFEIKYILKSKICKNNTSI